MSAEVIRGYVFDAGGGQVQIRVALDTESYPTLGAEVVLVMFPTAKEMRDALRDEDGRTDYENGYNAGVMKILDAARGEGKAP